MATSGEALIDMALQQAYLTANHKPKRRPIMLNLKMLLVASVATVSMAAEDCKAPEAVKNLGELLNSLFNGAKVTCDDGSSFSVKRRFECKGDIYIERFDPNIPTVVPSGEKVYVNTELTEKNGKVYLTEISYNDPSKYEKGEAPDKRLDTLFSQLNPKTIMFYAADAPGEKTWMTSVWYSMPDGKVKGYKLYADRSTACAAE